MKIIQEALPLSKLQRTSMTEEQIINSYKIDFEDVFRVVDNSIHLIDKVLDIGCGIAGWLGFFNEEYPNNNCKIYLLDKTQVDENLYYGYKEKTSFYNHMEIAKNNLITNEIKEENIFLQEATEDNKILFNEKFDLIVSFISCGFHYPIETYLDQIYDKLNENGIFICDIRKGTDGLIKLNQKFKHVQEIKEKEKYFRVKCIK